MSKFQITHNTKKLITQRQLLILRIKYQNKFNILSVLINATKLYMSLAFSSSYLKVQTQKGLIITSCNYTILDGVQIRHLNVECLY
ncbi:unnamed protein product (macronuclear) [Paramecium tetraurelia]|uniref:Uncharacterized protein n=1 Tax=Paramecium tetraurelia TaxID=5888 RepID=A0C735_PARTE|nr:uncharacterized protein GSPATT00035732001 [Paramecium tetraurelia]CAK66602.1 unnamed protein product [Paramecium tetraurelia]|eukprot:XP_001433999.1 hypothetical protein (macronuclear) [Paramecium tetraurelia strain d4-2]